MNYIPMVLLGICLLVSAVSQKEDGRKSEDAVYLSRLIHVGFAYILIGFGFAGFFE